MHPRLERLPCLDEVVARLGPAAAVPLRAASRDLNRAWWFRVHLHLAHQLGPRGWLATDYYRWWKDASRRRHTATACAFRSPELFEPVRRAFAEAAQRALARHLEPHRGHAAPLLRGEAAADQGGRPEVHRRLSPRRPDHLVGQYRAALGGMLWRQMWRKIWENLCWMPAVWSSVSYRDDMSETRVLDERVSALRLRISRHIHHDYIVDNPWDDLCLKVLPLEGDFLLPTMPHAPPAMPTAPHLPHLHLDKRRFLEGARAFVRHGVDDTPSAGLLRLYRLVAHRLPRYRPGGRIELMHDRVIHLERGERLDCLQLLVRGAEPVATLVARRGRYLRRAPVVRRARLLVAQPRLLPAFERVNLRYLRQCGVRRGECVWCGRLDTSGMCEDPDECRRLHLPPGP